MKNILIFFAAICFFTQCTEPTQLELSSPDEKISVKISIEGNLNYSVQFDDEELILNSPLSLDMMDAEPLGANLSIEKIEKIVINESWEPHYGEYKTIENNCTQAVVTLKEQSAPSRKFQVIFRAYNDGVAFRYHFPEDSGMSEVQIVEEKSVINLSAGLSGWIEDLGSYIGSQEHHFNYKPLSTIADTSIIGVPLVIKTKANNYLAITESNLRDWAAIYIVGNEYDNAEITSLRTHLSPGFTDNTVAVKRQTPCSSPWRTFIIGETPGDLVESELVLNLSDKSEIEDMSWIQPGKCAWDHWWSGDEKVDNETIKEYIDLASEMGWKYQLIDWQWYGEFDTITADATTVSPKIDMDEIREYAKSKDVKLWLWLYWTDIDRQMEEAFALYEEWGIVGIKIDFMQRDDQEMVNWYWNTTQLAAKHHLMINFHGAYKPTGLRRTYPNLMTREGVLGNEWNKFDWDDYWYIYGDKMAITPTHKVTLPFTRMLAGPMDYTPGAFLNQTAKQFTKASLPTTTWGTRCNELAMFVIYDSPVTTVCDHPDHYYGEKGAEFLKEVPTTWDDSKVLNGEIGEYITMARKSGDKWFLGAMTNENARSLSIKLDFLDDAEYGMYFIKDAKNADVDATQAIEDITSVKKGQELKIEMAPAGGFVAYLKKK